MGGGGGVVGQNLNQNVNDAWFSTKKKETKNMGLKYWILPNNHFKTYLIVNFWVGEPLPAWTLVWIVAQTLQAL